VHEVAAATATAPLTGDSTRPELRLWFLL
jgi:hypothetical protein